MKDYLIIDEMLSFQSAKREIVVFKAQWKDYYLKELLVYQVKE